MYIYPQRLVISIEGGFVIARENNDGNSIAYVYMASHSDSDQEEPTPVKGQFQEEVFGKDIDSYCSASYHEDFTKKDKKAFDKVRKQAWKDACAFALQKAKELDIS